MSSRNRSNLFKKARIRGVRRRGTDADLVRFGLAPAPAPSQACAGCDSHGPNEIADDVDVLLEGFDEVMDLEDAPLEQKMEPHGAVCVHVTEDGREAHYVVPVVRNRTRARDFVFIGVRNVECSDGDVLTGWCSATRQCAEPSFRRDAIPGSRHPGLPMEDVSKQLGPPCACADRLRQHLGDMALMATLQRGAGLASYCEHSEAPNVINFVVEGRRYVAVNPDKPYSASFFGEWGVTEVMAGGSYHCRSCRSTPRHCVHNRHVLGLREEATPDTSAEVVDDLIRRALTCEGPEALPVLDCVSREGLPFFPEEDPTVFKHWEGGWAHACCLPVITCLNSVIYYVKFRHSVYFRRSRSIYRFLLPSAPQLRCIVVNIVFVHIMNRLTP